MTAAANPPGKSNPATAPGKPTTTASGQTASGQSASGPAPGAQSVAGSAAAAVATRDQGGTPAAPVARPAARKTPTPQVVRTWLTLSVIAVLAFAIVGTATLLFGRAALGGAAQSVQQLSRVEAMRTDLLNADASAAHLYLGSGDTEYREALAQTRVLVVEAAEAVPADRPVLAEVNRDLDSYAAKLEEARVGRGTPAGQTALTDAGRHLREVVLPPLDMLVEANSVRVARQTEGLPLWPLVLTGALALAALGVTGAVTATRFRRLVNPGIAAGFVLVAVSFGIAVSTVAETNALIDRTAHNELGPFEATSAARGSAYDARAQEALALIERAGGPAGDAGWRAAADQTTAALDRISSPFADNLRVSWDSYASAHARVRTAAAEGRWEDAQALAVGTSQDTAGGRFAHFDQSVSDEMTRVSRNAQEMVQQPRASLEVAAAVTGLAGLVAAACALAGARPRLREYT